MAPESSADVATASAGLKEEIRQNLPFRSKGHEAYLSLLRTADQARHAVAEVIEARGVTLQQYNVLRILRGAGGEGLPTLEIADRMIERTPGITRLLDRLENKGWVTRERSPRDRRTVRCRATPSALALLEELDDPVFEANQGLFEGMTPGEVDQLIDLLAKLRAGMAG